MEKGMKTMNEELEASKFDDVIRDALAVRDLYPTTQQWKRYEALAAAINTKAIRSSHGGVGEYSSAAALRWNR